MYASKRSVTNAQGTDSKNFKINKARHRGMQKSHTQITPDGKVIHHYKMDARSAVFMKAFKKARKESTEKEAEGEVVETPETKETSE